MVPSQSSPGEVDPYHRFSVDILDSSMSYLDTGDGSPIVFMHGNGSYSYLWRNVIPSVEPMARCLAYDMVGMGNSGASGDGSYRFVDHSRYLDAWFDAMDFQRPVTLVGHDWGGALGIYWARRHPDQIQALVFMETVLKPFTWDDFPEGVKALFRRLRSPEGEELVLEQNAFIENAIPQGVLRDLTEHEMDAYRRPFLEPGEPRRPTLTWPREVPINGEPKDVHEIVQKNADWLSETEFPKLFINSEPGLIMQGPHLEYARSLQNLSEISVEGIHYIQEDSPGDIGRAITSFVSRIK